MLLDSMCSSAMSFSVFTTLSGVYAFGSEQLSLVFIPLLDC